jgi:hypothetical protein
MNHYVNPAFDLRANRLLNIAWSEIAPHNFKRRDMVQVMVITQNILLGDLLEILLAEAAITRVQRVWQTHPDYVLEQIDHYQPAVLVLEEGLLDEDCLLLLNNEQGRGRRQIILVHPQKNRVRVYAERQVTLTQSSDFIALVVNSSGYDT